MSDIAEGLGAAIEGSLAAKAVEPRAGSANEALAETECANCGAPLTGPYCNQCGQKAHVHRTLTAIAHDLIHGVLHLDGKLSRTLPLLIFKPGSLTRRYIDGERARFVSPMSMFLFSVFAMFAVFQMIGFTTPTNLNLGDQLVAKGEAEISRLAREIDALPVDDPVRIEREEELAAIRGFLNRAEAEGRTSSDDAEVETMWKIDENDANLTGFESIDKGLIKKWNENPGLVLYKLQANGYKFSWLLIPLSIPFVWLTFAWRRRFKAYDHAIFVTYSLAFMSLLFITASMFTLIEGFIWVAPLLMIFVPPIHIYKQLRGAYSLGRFSAFWRLLALSIFIWIVVLLFLQALLILGAF